MNKQTNEYKNFIWGYLFMKNIYFVLISLPALVLSAGANFTWVPSPPIVKLFSSFWS